MTGQECSGLGVCLTSGVNAQVSDTTGDATKT